MLPSIDDLQSRIRPLLEQSKRSGKNRTSSSQQGNGSSKDIIAQFQKGDCFSVAKQPIVQLSNEQVVGYEFLSRSSIKSFEMPNDFFRFALEAKILTLVDHHCFKACAAQATSLPPGAWCHINLFPSTLVGIPIQHLIDIIPAENTRRFYCIEISEQQILDDPSYLVEPVAAFQKAGIAVAIDDVGFGRSGLEGLNAKTLGSNPHPGHPCRNPAGRGIKEGLNECRRISYFSPGPRPQHDHHALYLYRGSGRDHLLGQPGPL